MIKRTLQISIEHGNHILVVIIESAFGFEWEFRVSFEPDHLFSSKDDELPPFLDELSALQSAFLAASEWCLYGGAA